MSKIKAAALGGALFLAGTFLATTANAVTMPVAGTEVPVATSSDIQPVAMKRWYYNQYQHGDRMHFRDHGHRFFRDGFWYASPFWLYTAPLYVDPGYGYGYGDYGDSHSVACEARYRSYDRYSDTFMGYDGFRHRCLIY